jgi:hypothetical protein
MSMLTVVFTILAVASIFTFAEGLHRYGGTFDITLDGWVKQPDCSIKTKFMIGQGIVVLILFLAGWLMK